MSTDVAEPPSGNWIQFELVTHISPLPLSSCTEALDFVIDCFHILHGRARIAADLDLPFGSTLISKWINVSEYVLLGLGVHIISPTEHVNLHLTPLAHYQLITKSIHSCFDHLRWGRRRVMRIASTARLYLLSNNLIDWTCEHLCFSRGKLRWHYRLYGAAAPPTCQRSTRKKNETRCEMDRVLTSSQTWRSAELSRGYQAVR